VSVREGVLLERSPLADTPAAASGWHARGNQLSLTVENELLVAFIMVARGHAARVPGEDAGPPGARMPAERSAAFNGPVTVVSAGRGVYLLVKKSEPGDEAFERLANGGEGQYSLVDCSDQFVFLLLEGPLSPRVLGALCSLDFDPNSFREGSAAVARLHDVRAYIWRGPGEHRYTIGVQRSLALHVWQELLDACMAHSVDP